MPEAEVPAVLAEGRRGMIRVDPCAPVYVSRTLTDMSLTLGCVVLLVRVWIVVTTVFVFWWWRRRLT